jgi:hypothetical protein
LSTRQSPACLLALLFVTSLAALAIAPAGAALAERQTYFFTNTAATVDKGNPLVVNPSELVLTQDGSWALERLQWTGWGSGVAHATGFSSASNGIPNALEGKRIIKPAKVALSKPGKFHGQRVYRCFRLTLPTFPRANQYRCLEHVGNSTLFLTPGSGDYSI